MAYVDADTETLTKKKERKESYLSPSRVLRPSELAEYQKRRKEISRMNYLRKIKELGKESAYRKEVEGQYEVRPVSKLQRLYKSLNLPTKTYAETRTGRLGEALGKGFTAISQRGGVAAASQGIPTEIYTRRQRGLKTIMGRRGLKRGRPKGTLDVRYAAYGGVYGFRKAIAHQRRLEKLQAQQRATITPQQQAVINQFQAKQQMQMMNPENKIIPDTYGNVYLGDLMEEINRAINAVR